MNTAEKHSFKKFAFIWSGQFLSVLGSAISSFGLSVWLFDKTGAATPFAISFLCSVLPSLLLSPLAGSLADRKNRKSIILLTDSGDAFLKLLMVFLLVTKNLRVWMVYPFMTISATLGTFQSPAFSASIPMLVGEKQLTRANGMRQLSNATQNMLAPIFAGILYPILHLEGLLIVDLCSYVFAFVTIILTKIPQPTIENTEKESKGFLSTSIRDFKESLHYLRSIPALFRAIIVFATVNFIVNMAVILLTPMVLSTYDATTLGLCQTISGVAMILGAFAASIFPEPKNAYARMYGVLIVSGAGLMIGGLAPHWFVISIGIFLLCLFVPYVNSLAQTILQKNVQHSKLGRLSAATSVLTQIATPMSALLSGVLADNIFGPMMMPGGVLAQSFVGNLIGIGEGRGIGLLYIINGIVLATISAFLLVKSSKRQ